MKRPAGELVEGLEEDGDERIDVSGCVFCRFHRLSIVGIAEPNTYTVAEGE